MTDSTDSSPPRRRPGRRWAIAVALLVAAGVAVVATVRASDVREPVTYITQEARVADLEEVVEGVGTVGFTDGADTALVAPVDGVVSAVAVAPGEDLGPLAPLLTIDGTTRYALPAAAPLYRPLVEGDEGADVEALERALQARGHDPGEVDETFTAQTAEALRAWQEEVELPATGALDPGVVWWVPTGGQVLAVDAVLGGHVAVGDVLVRVGVPGRFEVVVPLDQADVVHVQPDQRATIDIDGFDDRLTGRVISVASTPQDTGGQDYAVIVRADQWPAELRVGMSATTEVVVDVIEDAVVVPTGVVGGTATSATIPVLEDGVVVDRPVELGLVTATDAEVVSGLEPGTPVVLGEES